MTYALLGMACMIDDSRKDLNASAECLDALQRLCHCIFQRELCRGAFYHNAFWAELAASTFFGCAILSEARVTRSCRMAMVKKIAAEGILDTFLFKKIA